MDYDSSEYDSDMDIEELAYKRCNCPNYPSHQRSCFLNPKSLDESLKMNLTWKMLMKIPSLTISKITLISSYKMSISS